MKIYLNGKRGEGKYATVDATDYSELNKFTWYMDAYGYAFRNYYEHKRCFIVRMHSQIMRTPKGMHTDHINRNPLDNRRANLRTVSVSINMFNRPAQANNTSGHKGVHWDKRRRRWCATITVNRRHKYIGNFTDIMDAVKAREAVAKEYEVMPSKA